MSFEACARIVEKGDPKRFLAAMAAPVTARRVLFPLYAFNVEVARAPWVTEEPMIAEMRLQWWRDALEEIATGKEVRRHEVTTQLAEVLDPEGAKGLDRLVAARRWDIYKDPFEDQDHFNDYIEATAGELMWAAVRILGPQDWARESVLDFGWGVGLARYLSAVTALEDKGRKPLVDGTQAGIKKLAEKGLIHCMSPRGSLMVPARAAMIEGWEAAPIFKQIIRDPARVADGTVGLSPFRSRLRLARWAFVMRD